MKLTTEWQKGSRSNTNGACVEARLNGDNIEVRDSKDPAGPTLMFTRTEWTAFVDSVADGELRV